MIRSIGWGLYLSTSWTWCIGMWAPIIALSWFGWTGFFIFLIPNVLGTMFFGLATKTTESSKTFVENHKSFILAFSTGILVFHFFWISWIFTSREPNIFDPWEWSLPFWIIGIGFCLSRLPTWAWQVLALITASITFYLGSFYLPLQTQDWPTFNGNKQQSELIWFSVFSCLGFFGSPWLDATFHKARQEGGKVPFLIFPIFFIPTILITTLYAKINSHEVLIWPFLVHITIQTIFTCGAHLKEIETMLKNKNYIKDLILASTPILGIALAMLGIKFSTSEDIYLDLLGLYGVIFPLYVSMFARHEKTLGRKNILRYLIWALICAITSRIGLQYQSLSFLVAIPGLVALIFLFPQSTSTSSAS